MNMTHEEAIKHLKAIGLVGKPTYKALQIAISCIHKDMPKKPHKVVRSYPTTEGNVVTYTAKKCARCGANVDDWNYCPECGGRMK